MIALLAIRPEPGCAQTVEAARALGLEAQGCPLFEVRACDWSLPDEPVDAILAGSANAFRHGGRQLSHLAALPVHAVGEATAEAARDAGFRVASVGNGGLQALLDGLTGPLRLLRLAGAERVELAAPTQVELVERTVYAVEPLPLDPALAAQLGAGAIVLLHSAAQARHFAAECDRLGQPRGAISLAAIAPRVAEAAGSGWARIAAADRPHDAALLAMARAMCQEARP